MGVTTIPVIAATLIVLLTPPARSQNAPSADTSTEHYSLHTENLDAADVGRMLEEFYRQMSISFGKAPPAGKLRVEVYSTLERFHVALAADAQPQVDAGGYYSPGTRKAYLFVQPSDYFTRQLILHEATHQFHYLTATRNQGTKAKWYAEGLAEYYAMHNWDGAHLTLCIIPPITLEDYPAAAIDHFKNKLHEDLAGMISEKIPSERPEAWALIHFLADEYPKKLPALRARLDHQMEPQNAWDEVFGPITPKFTAQYEKWMEKNQQRWKIVSVSWQQSGALLEAKSKSSAMAVLKQTPKTLNVSVNANTTTGKPGLVFGFQSDQDFAVWQLWGNNEVRIVRRVKGQWAPTQSFNFTPRNGGAVLSLAIVRNAVALGVNGAEITRVESPGGQVGLYVQDGNAGFRVEK